MAGEREGRKGREGKGGEGKGEKEGESPPTLKCHRIHSLSLFFFSHKIVTRGPLKSRNCTRKLHPDPLGELEHSPVP